MLNRLPLTELASLLRRREIKPIEAVDAYLARIEAQHPAINAFTGIYADEARERARDLENRREPGPLHGVPVSIKDSFDIAGKPTWCGSKLRRDHRADRHSIAVERLLAAGAVILGKTNTPEFLMNYETDNFVAGRTNNPWDLERTPGGSSGGEAAAIADCQSAGGMGSDGGGSIRQPAHFCGIAGLKPTPGRVPATGHFPLIQHPGGLLGVGGPMARTARDVAALFRVVAGHHWSDPFSCPVQPAALPSPVSSVRIGVMEQFYDVPVTAETRAAVQLAASLAADAGFAVDAFEMDGQQRSPNVWSFFFTEVPLPLLRASIEGNQENIHWTGREFYQKNSVKPDPTCAQILENFALRDALRAKLLEQMQDTPVLLMPVASTPAHLHRERRFATEGKDVGLFQNYIPLYLANIFGLPAMTIPMTLTPGGLPIGIQLVGRPWEEELILAIAAELESARGAFPNVATAD